MRAAGESIRLVTAFLLTCGPALPLMAIEDSGEDGEAAEVEDGEATVARRLHGPFPIQLLHPLTAPFYQPLPDVSRTLEAGKLAVSLTTQYGSVQRTKQEGRNLAIFDGEFHSLALNLRYGLLDEVEVRLAIPIYSRGSGFLDQTIQEFHEATGLVRDERSKNQFDEILVVNDKEVIRNNSSGYRLGDIPLQVKIRLLDEAVHPVGVAIRGALEFPTGDESEWMGSGKVDGGIGLLLERSLGDFSFYGNLDARFITRPDRFDDADIEFRSVPAGMAAIEWRAFRRAAIVLQVNATESLFDDEDLETLNNAQVQLLVGLHLDFGERAVAFLGLAEDLVRASSPDVVFFFGLRVDLGYIIGRQEKRRPASGGDFRQDIDGARAGR